MYKQEDLDSIEKAIKDLQSGKRVTSISHGETRVSYADIQINDLLKLRLNVMGALERGEVRKRRIVMVTSKGL